ncbi:UDP-glucose dehydrogenase family protein [Paenibacillus hexagrammi]|uniref:UDP-glucose 6-dehydrogenase n=1 Tax=Paenibacillus hexagrammi TaxID=2908839 RepID=A0ABY3SDQ6_9BACL|nr:UDP-glucose/GDP-mannose dehydrogenase family protein [Paenibacillus sp. YPD9-1]UJF32107.1 UDP-glucose/GDP-mannose dehydrogenase family protein [Paenibacillus sp. YPD9-1]
MEVVCIGSGYVGSVTGTAFAALGYPTVIVDTDSKKVDEMNRGVSPIFEPHLSELISQMVHSAMLSATQSYECVYRADVIFIAVGTPSRSDGTADLKYVESAARSLGKHLNPGKFTVIVNKSTVPAGTAQWVASLIEEASGLLHNQHFAVVSNPEFLREGYALEDVFFPDRIVVGAGYEQAADTMRALYQPLMERNFLDHSFIRGMFAHRLSSPAPVYVQTDATSAELIKYVSNAFLAVKISYMNEVARLCEALGANVLDVAYGMGLDSRIGAKFLQVSSGWSGSCFPKDTAEILQASQRSGSELTIVKAAVQANQGMHDYCIHKVERALTSLQGKHIGILGLTFKPNTDDARSTQASYIIEKLLKLGATVAVHDPQGMEMFRKVNPHLTVHYCERPEDTAHTADGIILLTHWEEYQFLHWDEMRSAMNYDGYILDTRNFLDPQQLDEAGFIYEGLGK